MAESISNAWLAKSIIQRRPKDAIKSYDIDPLSRPPGTRVWNYLRHSPGDKQSLESQREAVENFCNEKGWIIDRTFVDKGKKGSSVIGRDGFDELISVGQRKPYELQMILIVWDYSRLNRDSEDAPYYRSMLRHAGWMIYSMNDKIMQGPMAYIQEAIIDFMNSYFLIMLRANVLRGLRTLASHGVVPGGQISLGYNFEEVDLNITTTGGGQKKGRKPVPNDDLVPLITRAFEMKATGATNSVIAKETSLFKGRSGSWNNFFRNTVYIGELEFHGEIYKDIYPPIIPLKLFNTVQEKLTPLRKYKRHNSQDHPRGKASERFLTTHAFCALCGAPIEADSDKGSANRDTPEKIHYYYICSQHKERLCLCPNSTRIPAYEVEKKVLEVMKNIITDENLTSLLEWTNRELNRGLEDLILRIRSTEEEYRFEYGILSKMDHNILLIENITKKTDRERLLNRIEVQREKVEGIKQMLDYLQERYEKSCINVPLNVIKEYIERTNEMLNSGNAYLLKQVVSEMFSRILMDSKEIRLETHFPEGLCVTK